MNAQRIYRASPRGIGIEWKSGVHCYCCGNQDAGNNCAFLVPSRETGEAIVQLFTTGAWLDYRDYEPKWIQVKVNVCKSHVDNLEKLIELVLATKDRLDGPGINTSIIEESLS